MKIITTSALLMALLAGLTTADSGDRGFNATAADDAGANHTTHRIKTAANFKGGNAQIQLCPSGDCINGQAITLSMSRLEEIGTDPTKPVQSNKNFNALNGSWSAFELMTVNGTQAYMSSFVTTFKLDKDAIDTTFNLTTMIYQANGTAMNGNQSIDVPAGALKFSVTIKGWPFKDPANKLQFGVNLKAQGKKGGANFGDPQKGAKAGKVHMERVDMGQSMFMDTPTMALVDTDTVPINSSVSTQGGKTELIWVFPSFKTSLYYDPTMGSEDPSAAVTSDTNGTTGTTGTTPTTTPAATTAAPKSSASHITGMVVATALAFMGAWMV